MERYMITHSLLSSWLYAMKDNPYEDAETEPEDPLEEFRKVLNREPTETNEAMAKGIRFEDMVTALTLGNTQFPAVVKAGQEPYMERIDQDPWYDAACKVAGRVYGGQLQVKCCKTVVINGMYIFLYGRLDALKAGNIYDIKFTSKYDRGKFFDSTQHPMYMELVPDAKSFSYLVSDGSSVWTETYRRDEVKNIIPVIQEFLDWLDASGLMATYKSKWIAL